MEPSTKPRNTLDCPPNLSVVLPAYLEAQNLDILLPKIKSIIQDIGINAEIIVVDAATPQDDTQEICKKHDIRGIHRYGGETYGAAVRSGLAEARGEYILFMDADGSHNPEYLQEIWKKRDQQSIVIASRYIKGGSTDNPTILIFLSWVLNIIYRVTLGFKCRDISNSFRLYPGKKVKSLELYSKDFDIVEEILVKIVALYKIKIIETPIRFEKRIGGKSKRQLWVFIFGYIFTLFRLLRFRFHPSPKEIK